MLRITSVSTHPEVQCLKLEGRLVGDWVEVLQVEVEQARARTRDLELNLAGVEFADAGALSLLLQLEKHGVRLVACSPLLTSLLESKAS